MPKNNISISVVIITRNEEGNIQKCLDTVSWVDEIIIIDSYSDDKTVEIAKNYTDKIFFNEWKDSFSEQKNFGISKANGKWLLVLDADERLSPELQSNIKKIIKNGKYNGYWFSRKTFITPTRYLAHGFFYPDYQLKLFRNNLGISYENRVHEEPKIPKVKTIHIKKDILHFPSKQKYDKLSAIGNLSYYMKLSALDFLEQKKSAPFYLYKGIYIFFDYFIGSSIRGKGYLDGWDGFVAAFNFASAISVAYFYAAILRLKGKIL